MADTNASRTSRCAHCAETVSSVTHDVKSFITVVGGYVELLLANKLGELTPQQKRVLEEVRCYIDGLNDYAKRLLEVSKMQGTETELEKSEGDIKTCIQELLQLWAPTFESKNIANYLLASEVPRFRFDHKRIQQVISRLLDNTLRFTPSGGTVSVVIEPYVWQHRDPKNSEQDVQKFSTTNSVRVIVVDSASGTSPEFQQEIFDSLWQADSSPSNSTQGTALAFARRVVQQHGGRLWVESEPGVENRYCVLLPLHVEGNDLCAAQRSSSS